MERKYNSVGWSDYYKQTRPSSQLLFGDNEEFIYQQRGICQWESRSIHREVKLRVQVQAVHQ